MSDRGPGGDLALFDRVEPQLRDVERRFEEIERQVSDPEIARDPGRLSELLRERGRIEATVSAFRDVREARAQLAAARAERKAATGDADLEEICDQVIKEAEARCAALGGGLLAEFVRDDDDAIPRAIVEVRAGTGGDEATLWAADLLRMYLRCSERKRWKVEVLDEQRSVVDGVKEAVLSISGDGCYGYLKFESGGHRVQRVPETETQGRIHTSAATVAVMLEPSEVEVVIRDQDLKIEAFRSSGPGGQKVNKTSSAIRVTHLPSGLAVSCQDEKSQHKNKARALKILRSRLYDAERRAAHEKRSTVRRSLIGSGDRSERIRTYNYPQNRVSDHRIGLTLHDLQSVLDGDLDRLVESLAEREREHRLQALAADLL
jgi:peptide chain release factor 1